jgi:uncharacterized damage-inducible protein DinB
MNVPTIPTVGDERTMLVAFLDYYRAVIIDKCLGLTKEQLATRLQPSDLTLPGIAFHLAAVEEDWFVGDMLGEEMGEPWASVDWDAEGPDWEWRTAPTLDIEDVLDTYRRAIARSNEVAASAESLDQLSVRTHPRTGEPWSLRFILIHMIEETARHAGHADLIRESIDGEVGDFRDESEG